MKILLTVVALVAVAQASPITTQTMEIGSNGVASGSVLNIPLVEIIVNTIKDAAQALAPGTANEPVHVAVPVVVVDEAQNLPEPGTPSYNPLPLPEVVPAPVLPGNPIDVISVNPGPGNPIDVISVNPVPAPVVQPEPTPAGVVPAPIVLPEPTPAQVVPAPIVLPEPTPAQVVPAPIVLPEPTPAQVVPAPIVLPEPTPAEVVPAPIVLPEPTPAEVVPAPIVLPEPTPAEVIEVEPIQVVEVAPETSTVASEASGSQIINVFLNFIFGDDGSLSSVEVPAHVISQIVGSPSPRA